MTPNRRPTNPRPSRFGIAVLLAAAGAFGLGAAREARAACTPAAPTTGDVVTCTGSDSTGYDAAGVDQLSVTVEAGALLDDSSMLDAALSLGDDGRVFVDDARIVVTDAGGTGIVAGDDGSIESAGRIEVQADGATGVSVGARRSATNALGETVVVDSRNFVDVTGDDSVGIRGTEDALLFNSGTIRLSGIDTVGLELGDRARPDAANGLLNRGTVLVRGNGAIGLEAGDGWTALPSSASFAPAIRHDSDPGGVDPAQILVEGTDAFGIRVGRDSFVLGDAPIDVSGVDAIGVSLGGNDLLNPNDGSLDVFESFENRSQLTGGPDAGALVEFRGFGSGANRVRNLGGILADLTNRGIPGRAIAIRGSNGVEDVINTATATIQGDLLLLGGSDRVEQRGALVGDVDLGDGDDELLVGDGATLAAGYLYRGGAGSDSVRLLDSTSLGAFDVARTTGFETLRVGGGAGWSLSNTAGFSGLTRIDSGGLLVVSSPITLGGDLEVDASGTIDVVLDGSQVPLTVVGNAALDGTLRVRPDPNLAPSMTGYRVLLAASRGTTEFADVDVVGASGTRVFTALYDMSGVLLTYEILPTSALALGRNNAAVLAHLKATGESPSGAPTDVAQYFFELDGLSTAEANEGFAAISPEAYDAQTTALFEGGRRVAQLLLDRPRACDPKQLDPWTAAEAPLPCHAGKWGPWVAGLGGFRSRDAFAGHPGYDANLGGLAFGVDAHPLDSLDLTLAIASQHGTVDVDRSGESTLTLIDLAGDAAWRVGPVRVQGVLGWGHGFHDDERSLRFVADGMGTLRELRATASHDSDRVTLASEVGAAVDIGSIVVEPIVTLDWAWIWQRGFDERGAGGFSLEVASRDDSIGSLRSGLRFGTTFHHAGRLARALDWTRGVWRPRIDVRWRQSLAGSSREIEARFSQAPANVRNFTIEGEEDDGGVEIAAAIGFVPEDTVRLQLELQYEAYVASHTLDQGITGRLRFAF